MHRVSNIFCLVLPCLAACSAQWQGPTRAHETNVVQSFAIKNLQEGQRTATGFLVGTSSGSPAVGCQYDGGAIVAATGTDNWKCVLPTTWQRGSSHTIVTGMVKNGTLTNPVTLHVKKGENHDVNGDGYADVAWGDYLANIGGLSQNGAAYAFYGSPSGLDTTIQTSMVGTQTAEQMGTYVRFGDVNGDGYADLLVTAPQYNISTPPSGAVLVFLGSANGLPTSPSITIVNPDATRGFAQFAAAGDLNGDGYDDIVAATTSGGGGMIGHYVYFGSPSGPATSPSLTLATPLAGFQAAIGIAVGDVNGDGYADALIGVIHTGSGFGGNVFVFYGAAGTSMSTTAALTLSGAGGADCYGESIAIGDVDGDGIQDAAIGSTCAYVPGAAYVYLGSGGGLSAVANRSWTGHTGDETFGATVTIADLNDDGYGDVAVGAPYFNSNTGGFYVYNGSASGASAAVSYSRFGASTGTFFAYGLSTSDLNNDNVADLLLASYGGANGYGMVFLGNSAGLSASPDVTIVGPNSGGFFGYSVASPAPFLSLWRSVRHFFRPPPAPPEPPYPPRIR